MMKDVGVDEGARELPPREATAKGGKREARVGTEQWRREETT